MIHTHSTLEAGICEAKAIDAHKVRYGKEGPARQGQAGHRLAEAYLTHLFRTKQETDFDAGEKMLAALMPMLSAEDEAAVREACEGLIRGDAYPWVATARDFEAERPKFFRVPSGEYVEQDRVHLEAAPLFRVTPDIVYWGDGPQAMDGRQRWHVVDLKLHRQIEHVDAPAVNRQLLRYSAALFSHFAQSEIGPDDDVGLWIWYPRRKYFEGALVPQHELATAWKELVVGPVGMAESRLARPVDAPDRCVGSHCRDCDLRRGCDAALRYPQDIVSLTDATAAQVLTALAISTKTQKDIQAQLKRMLGEGGLAVVTAGDVEAEVRDTEIVTFNRDDVRRHLDSVVDDSTIDGCFRATKGSIEKALSKAGVPRKERISLLEELKAIGDVKLQSRLHVGRVLKERAAAGTGEDDA